MRNKEELEVAIENKRIEMVRIGMTKGLTNSTTVKCSQELDELLNNQNETIYDINLSCPSVKPRLKRDTRKLIDGYAK